MKPHHRRFSSSLSDKLDCCVYIHLVFIFFLERGQNYQYFIFILCMTKSTFSHCSCLKWRIRQDVFEDNLKMQTKLI